jgi:hypothetical protein
MPNYNRAFPIKKSLDILFYKMNIENRYTLYYPHYKFIIDILYAGAPTASALIGFAFL